MEDCIFCKIARKELPSTMVMETEDLVIFKDLYPKAPLHLLIVPRVHIRSINDIEEKDSEILAKLFFAARDVAKQEGVAKSGYRLQLHVEKGGGQEIFHLHMHLMAKK